VTNTPCLETEVFKLLRSEYNTTHLQFQFSEHSVHCTQCEANDMQTKICANFWH